MFTSFSKSVTTLFTMINDFLEALGSIARVAKDTAGAYEDEARATRAAQQIELNKQLKLTSKADKATS